MKDFKIPFTILVLILVVGIICFLLGRCDREEGSQTTNTEYIKGKDSTAYFPGKPDTVIKEKPIFIRAKSIVKVERDTVHYWHTASDTVQVYPYTLLIKDTLREGVVDRDVIMTGYDSTFFITRVDTVKTERVDTVKIETIKKRKGVGILCAACFSAGYAIGSAVP